jgi:glycosyltransferase involved in cell wall biosynthesis
VSSRKVILFLANVDWFFISHRLVLAEASKKIGFEVYVAAEDTGKSEIIRNAGLNFINLSISRSGTNLFREFLTVFRFCFLYLKVKPTIVHHITLKPVVYGTLVCRLLGIQGIVNAISGLGYNFIDNRTSFGKLLMTGTMRFAFNRKNVIIIFQNETDQRDLNLMGVIRQQNLTVRIKGSGVDLTKFSQVPFPSFEVITILLPSRMLWDKGVRELREASEILKIKYSGKIQFILSGIADSGNKSGVSESYLNDWADGVYVKWLGYQSNMVEVYRNAHIVVLPSYREGMPKSLMEACAMGRAIVTTNAVGCDECVDDNVNGYKVPVKSIDELVIALEKLIDNPAKIIEMGNASRIKAINEFNVQNVISEHLAIYRSLLNE